MTARKQVTPMWDDSVSVASGSSAVSGLSGSTTLSAVRYNNLKAAAGTAITKGKKSKLETPSNKGSTIYSGKTNASSVHKTIITEENIPLLADNDHMLYTGIQKMTRDGEKIVDLLSTNGKSQPTVNDQVCSNVRVNSLTHNLQVPIDPEKRKLERIYDRVGTPNISTAISLDGQPTNIELQPIHVPHLENHPDPEASATIGLLNIEQKQAESHVQLTQFYRLFLNKHTLFTKLETCSSRGILAALVIPMIVCIFVATSSPYQYHFHELSANNYRALAGGRIQSLWSLTSTDPPVFGDFYKFLNSISIIEIDVTSHENQQISLVGGEGIICPDAMQSIYDLDYWASCAKVTIDKWKTSRVDFATMDTKMIGASSYLYFNITTQGKTLNFDVSLKLLSPEYILYTSLMSLIATLIALVVSLSFCINISSRSKFMYTTFIRQLPYIYTTIFSHRHFILPEQYTIIFALICIILALNPIQSSINILHYFLPHIHRNMISPILPFFFSMLSSNAFFVLYACCVWYLDGLKYNPRKNECIRIQESPLNIIDTMIPNDEASSVNHPSKVVGPNLYFQNRLAMIIQNVHSMFILPHHPNSVHFWRFTFWKLMVLFISWGCVISFHLLDYNVTVGLIEENDIHCALSIFRILMVGCHVGWIIWITLSLLATGKSLRKLKYFPTRFRQLSYQLCCYQLGLGFIVFAIWKMYANYSTESLEMNSLKYVSWMLRTNYPALNVEVFISFIYLAVMMFVLSYTSSSLLHLQPASITPVELIKTEAQGFVPLKREYDDFLSHACSQNQTPFCLELACYLLEATYLTYFNADEIVLLQEVSGSPATTSYQQSTCSAPLPPTLDVARLGMLLREVFFNDNYCTFGYLGEINGSFSHSLNTLHRDEYVVAFRGSMLANVSSDFNFGQIPLPVCTEGIQLSVFMDYLCSKSGSNVLQRAHLTPTPQGSCDKSCSAMKTVPLINHAFPRVHAGFWDAYDSLREQYLRGITNVIFHHYEKALRQVICKSHGNESAHDQTFTHLGCDIYLCGHSLGGAMAVLAAMELSLNMNILLVAIFQKLGEMHPVKESSEDRLKEQSKHKASNMYYMFRGVRFLKPNLVVYAYGCPRIGNAAFAELFDSHISTCYRVSIEGDMITKMPKIEEMYRHVGRNVLIDEEGKGDVIINPSFIENSFLQRTTDSICHHRLEKYRINLEACFEPEDFEDYLQRETWSLQI